jgi:hypothetical protein
MEQVWDILLSEGRTVYGTATDDSHNYTDFTPTNDNPGKGWVVCRVKELTVPEILSALDSGNFYFSDGVELETVDFDGKALKIAVNPAEKISYTIRFIGKHGRIVSETSTTQASCVIPDDGKNSYIRAKVISSDGKAAWTQAFRRIE